MRLNQVARKLNVGTNTIVDFLKGKGHVIENNPNTKVSEDQIRLLSKEFQDSALEKEEASELQIGKKNKNIVIDTDVVETKKEEEADDVVTIKNISKPAEYAEFERPKLGTKVLDKIDLDAGKKKQEAPAPTPKKEEAKDSAVKANKQEEKPVQKVETPKTEAPKVETPKVDTPKVEKPVEVKKEVVKEKPVETKPSSSAPEKVEVKQVEPKVEPQATPVTPTTVAPEPIELITAKADELKGLTVLGKMELPIENKKKKGGKPEFNRESAEDKKKKRKRLNKSDKPVDVNKAGQNFENRGNNNHHNNNNNNSNNNSNNNNNNNNQNRNQGDRKFSNDKKPGGNNFNKGGNGNNFNRGGNNGGNGNNNNKGGGDKKRFENKPVNQGDVNSNLRNTVAKFGQGRNKTARSKYKREKRREFNENREEQMLRDQAQEMILQVTEFVSANDLASLMNVGVNQVISKCMSLGMFVSINQRLDAEAIQIIADEFGYEVEFNTAEDEMNRVTDAIEDNEEDLIERAPVVTIMGHVDHGKTSMLDYIRKTKVAAGEAGGITQHIGAYSVKTDSGKRVTFLDTPGHEAFTAMRARGAKLTDIVILVVAADDQVMPQTREAINHAQIAGVPIIVAITKVDKPGANPEKVREQLSIENILVEDWGGKYQCQEVSNKSGLGIEELLEKVLIEAELMELKANPDRSAQGAVVEATLDKGRGYVTNILVQNGTLKIGDIVVAGANHGRVKAMTDNLGRKIKEAGPSTPLQLLGLDGAPQAGDKFIVVETEREAREICNKRAQLVREQQVRTKKHLTLDEIGRRLAIGSFKELNLIIKGDVDGSVEALTDSLLKLSTDEVSVNVIHKAVGQITESDVLLASASDAIVLGFQVRPSAAAKKIADTEQIQIKTYSIIYQAIDEIKDALEGMLEPETEEVVTGNIQIRDVFKISKVGTVAGCYVTDGYVNRHNKIRVIRQGIVKYEGEIGALKRFKDDVAEVKYGYECGLSIKNYNDLEIDDIIESYEIREIKRKL